MENPNDIKLDDQSAANQLPVTANSSIKDHLLKSHHIEYLMSFSNTTTTTSQNSFDDDLSTDYLKMSGMFWVISGLAICDRIADLPADHILDFYRACFDPNSGGIAPSIGHDPHILSTLSAVQVLVLLKKRPELETNADAIVKYIRSLQNDDGSFNGDKWGEVDTRFSFCAVAILALLNRLDAINVEKAVEYIRLCQNFDGGFGSRQNTESHAGLTYCCVGVLAITKSLDRIDRPKLVWWLADRQCESGGFNGRPEKLPDVCYSWWVLASLRILNRVDCICGQKLRKFILMCQDDETGGFADRPGNMVDPFHTLFGLGALSLLGNDQLVAIDPIFCMTSTD